MRAFVTAIVVSGAALLSGCGAWTVTNAQEALMVGAEATEEMDQEIAPIISQAIDRCDETTTDREGLVECMAPYLPIRYGVRLTRASLLLGQAAVDAWRAGEDAEGTWVEVAGCIGRGLGIIAREVRALELDATLADVVRWIDTFGGIAGNLCPDELLESPRFQQALERER